MEKPSRQRAFVLGVVLLAAGCAAPPGEPANLQPHKDELRRYVSSGRYEHDIAAVAARAGAWIGERAARKAGGERLAMVFDLDETLLSNLPFMREQDFGGSDPAWDEWMGAGKDTAIEPVREVYRMARRLDVEIVFITSRTEKFRASTERNLRDAGCGEYAVLVMMGTGDKRTSAAYKTAERKRLAGEGRTIIASVGDQESDLAGGYAEKTFKLPNPFYFSP